MRVTSQRPALSCLQHPGPARFVCCSGMGVTYRPGGSEMKSARDVGHLPVSLLRSRFMLGEKHVRSQFRRQARSALGSFGLWLRIVGKICLGPGLSLRPPRAPTRSTNARRSAATDKSSRHSTPRGSRPLGSWTSLTVGRSRNDKSAWSRPPCGRSIDRGSALTVN